MSVKNILCLIIYAWFPLICDPAIYTHHVEWYVKNKKETAINFVVDTTPYRIESNDSLGVIWREPLQEDGEPTFDLMYDFPEYIKHSFSLVTEDGECLMEYKKGEDMEGHALFDEDNWIKYRFEHLPVSKSVTVHWVYACE
mgnify:FL=1